MNAFIFIAEKKHSYEKTASGKVFQQPFYQSRLGIDS